MTIFVIVGVVIILSFLPCILSNFPTAELGGAVFADVTSANVVGYQNVIRPGQQYFCSGSMFKNIGSEGIRLYDLKITGTMSPSAKAQWRGCNINFFKAGGSAIFDPARKYWMDWNGKWRLFKAGSGNPDGDEFVSDDDAKAEVINPGEAFVCSFGNASATIVYSGEVIKGNSEKKISILRPGQQYFIVTNPSGRTISLKDITITGTMSPSAKAQWRGCNINFFKSGGSAIFDPGRKYWMDWNGKWRLFKAGSGNPDGDEFVSDDDAEAETIAPGEGFVCNFGNASATITMPSAL